MPESSLNQLVSHLFRHEAGKMAAVLIRMVGIQQYDLAQDIVQETLLKAMQAWKINGIPENPTAWLYTVAKRKAIDAIREKKLHAEIEAELAKSFHSEFTFAPAVEKFFLSHEIEDSQLRMMFVCCHPSIPYESQVALTLKTLCGLSVSEIAHSFLTVDETITKRLYRAREKIREEKIDLELPNTSTLTLRLESVLHTLYLLFNEGYNSSHPDKLIRHELCEEAIRLCLLLTVNPLTNKGIVQALLALMCFQSSREKARLTDNGNIILLQDQDRTLWSKKLIEKGNQYLNQSATSDEFTEYHLEAAIAACHANASSFNKTDWARIVTLYELLSTIKPDPFVDMNKAIAFGYAHSVEQGLEKLIEIKGLEQYSIYHTALGDFFLQVKNNVQAKEHFKRALSLTQSNAEKNLIQQKLTLAVD